MSQIETTKVVGYVATGSITSACSASKVVAYMVLVPGESEADDSNRQGHVHPQILRRR